VFYHHSPDLLFKIVIILLAGEQFHKRQLACLYSGKMAYLIINFNGLVYVQHGLMKRNKPCATHHEKQFTEEGTSSDPVDLQKINKTRTN
jgi:hypothetical protein